MEKLSPGQIHLADQRGFAETNIWRRYSSFNYGNYFNEHRKPFSRLEVLNDEILTGGKTTVVTVENSCWFVLIPITGEIHLKKANGNPRLIDVGEVFISHAAAGESFELINPYESDRINYLYMQIKNEAINLSADQVFKFDFINRKNELIDLTADIGRFPFSLHIGQFAGRTDVLYQLRNKDTLFYAFVIAGAFEVQGRLMHERDGLALWQLNDVDLEALSNNAVIAVLETDR
jgi:redox-sensitive bicupin YhaK (pirin superfamily)